MVINADCIEHMNTMPPDSVDSIVTDPPYHLTSIVKRFGKEGSAPAQFGTDGAYARASRGFMGKEWDGGDIAFRTEVWEAALRVAKPGAYLLAFGGTRTFHRMAVAIEDAGWEIRDTVMWVYGSGFPKSHNVGKGIDKAAGAEREVVGINESINIYKENKNHKYYAEGSGNPEYAKKVITAPATDTAKQWDGWGTALKPAQEIIVVARKSSDDTVRDTIATNLLGNLLQLEARLWLLLNASIAEKNLASNQTELSVVLNTAQWTAEKFINTRGDLFALMGTRPLEWVLITSLNTVSSWRSTWEEALKLGSMFITETVKSPITDLKILKSSLSEITPDFIIQAEMIQHGSWLHASPAAMIFNAALSKLSATLAHSAIESAISRGHIPHPDAVDKAVLNSPIIVARKPLEGTVVANMLAHGTGAMNIDGCRVGTSESLNGGAYAAAGTERDDGWGMQRGGAGEYQQPTGRWPANLIHDGSDEVVALFPETGKSTGGRIGKKSMGNVTNVPAGQYEKGDPGYGDSGSAARFFYCAKANKDDRNEGLEEFEDRKKVFNGKTALPSPSNDVEGSVNEKFSTHPQKNHHPTVKPTALMRYLCKLVTRAGGTVLDPFCGSGSTGKAAILEGFKFIGIEKDPEYHKIAEARINLQSIVQASLPDTSHNELEVGVNTQSDMFK